MKTVLLFAAVLGLGFAGLPSARAVVEAPRVTVTFVHPENFTDVKDSFFPTDKGRDAILKSINDYLVRQGTFYLPKGYRLALTFTDIDLAGDFEPWRGVDFDNIRIVKDIYPPDFKFSYQVTDPAGRIVRQGKEDIRDLAFTMRADIDTQDPLHFEKDILNDWLRNRLRGLGP